MRSPLTIGSIYLHWAIDSEPILKSLLLSCLFKSKNQNTKWNSPSSKNSPVTVESKVKYNFFQFVLEYSEFLLSISGPKGISKNRKKYEKTKSIYKLLWVLHKNVVKTWTFWYMNLPTAMFSTLLSFHP